VSSGSKKKKPRYACLSEIKAPHSQRVRAEVSSSVAHLLYNGLSDSPIKCRCLLRVLCPVIRPVTTLDCVLFKNRNLALAPRQSPEINSRVCLWMSPRPRHHAQCWLTNQRLNPSSYIFPRDSQSRLSSNKLQSRSVFCKVVGDLFSLTPACPGTEKLLVSWSINDPQFTELLSFNAVFVRGSA
jgi:hypothetical protein